MEIQKKKRSDYYQYSKILHTALRPECVCFYNGTGKRPEKKVLKLSEAFSGESNADIEVCVAMLNINCGKNKILMIACKPLDEVKGMFLAVKLFLQNF